MYNTCTYFLQEASRVKQISETTWEKIKRKVKYLPQDKKCLREISNLAKNPVPVEGLLSMY